MNTKIRAILLALMVVLCVLPSVQASDESVSASATVNPTAPSIHYVEITDTSLVISRHLDVDREYYLHVHSIDKNGLNDITSVICTLYFAQDGTMPAGTESRRSCYTLSYAFDGTQATWGSVPAGYVSSSTSSATPEGYLSKFIFAFSLDKTAIPSGATNTWYASIVVTDTSCNTTQYDLLPFDVNEYIEWSGIPTELHLSSASMDPESPWDISSPPTITATVTSNVPITVLFEAEDLAYGPNVIGCELFSLEVDATYTGGTVNPAYDQIPTGITEGQLSLMQDMYGTPCTLEPALDGYNDASTGLLSCTIDAVAGSVVPYVPAGMYSATWTFTIERGSGITP